MELRLKELEITSPAFSHLGAIPQRYTSDGENISPPLEWDKVPPETQMLVLICHDPDAPLPSGFTHWVLYNIPPSVKALEENDGAQFTQGVNTLEEEGYTGPAPPPNHGRHHYYFWLYALKENIDVGEGWTREFLIEAIDPFVIAQARLVGTYER